MRPLADDDGPVFSLLARARDAIEVMHGKHLSPMHPQSDCPQCAIVRDLNLALKGTKWEEDGVGNA